MYSEISCEGIFGMSASNLLATALFFGAEVVVQVYQHVRVQRKRFSHRSRWLRPGQR